MKIGVLGGTFDPVHNGHLEIAQQAMYRLGLSKVLFVPANEPPLKGRPDVLPAEHRVKMVERAVQDRYGLDISKVELEREGPSYTVDTLNILKGELNSRDEIYFILGWDSLLELPQWKDPEEVVKLCRLVAFPRPAVEKPDLKKLEGLIPGLYRRLIMLQIPPIAINSTDIRSRVAQGLSIKGLVPQSVLQYINDNGLYLNERPANGAS
jgi:nicotinate-nucleotide adenylyltransferase